MVSIKSIKNLKERPPKNSGKEEKIGKRIGFIHYKLLKAILFVVSPPYLQGFI